MLLSITGKLHTTPEDPPRPAGRYVYQRCASGTGNIPSDDTGRSMVRRHVYPTNPRTPAQMAHRGRMAAAVRAWHAATPAERASYAPAASKRGLSAYHLFVADYIRTHPATAYSAWRTMWDDDRTGWDSGKTDWRSAWDAGATLFDL